jgi:NADH-quinone oxidoreductase subunit G
MPKCTINGVEVEAREGATIIEAMKDNNLDIAHYCWHPGLSVAGVCRLCMVEIEGNPRLQIACNTPVAEGMVITNKSDKVEEAVKWGLDFHLINHPLDCPICDQAGECGLQDQYMQYGKYDSEMAERKVKKHKVVDLGEKIVLDSERCILCSRCVRFTTEVTKTEELGIFHRGDRSEIGTVAGKALDNDYSVNTVDICPVGALTSKDFRFQQRVWYLKDSDTVCPGCSTGCSTKLYYNKSGVYRVKPVYNEKVNGHWMCDQGRDTYKFINKEHRLLKARVKTSDGWDMLEPGALAKMLHQKLADSIQTESADSVALVLTGQYTNEEYAAVKKGFIEGMGIKNVFHWRNNPDTFEDFDGLLIRGDKNPNTKGLLKMLADAGISATWNQLEEGLNSGKFKSVIVAGPENPAVFTDIAENLKMFSKARVIWMGAPRHESFDSAEGTVCFLPLKTYAEKAGTFTNHQGEDQSFDRALTVVPAALTLTEAVTLISGKEITIEMPEFDQGLPQHVTKETRVKNEFLYKRGQL